MSVLVLPCWDFLLRGWAIRLFCRRCLRRSWEDKCAGLLWVDRRKPLREEWRRPRFRTVRGAGCFQLLSSGVGHMVAVDEQ